MFLKVLIFRYMLEYMLKYAIHYTLYSINSHKINILTKYFTCNNECQNTKTFFFNLGKWITLTSSHTFLSSDSIYQERLTTLLSAENRILDRIQMFTLQELGPQGLTNMVKQGPRLKSHRKAMSAGFANIGWINLCQ